MRFQVSGEESTSHHHGSQAGLRVFVMYSCITHYFLIFVDFTQILVLSRSYIIPVSDLYFSPWTLVEHPCMVIYPKHFMDV